MKKYTILLSIIFMLFGQGSRQLDSLALVALYNATNGVNWSDPWDFTQGIDTFSGVTLSSGRVTSVKLSSRGLNGSIPDSIRYLTEITNLWLQSNDLGGAIPAAIGNLNKLTSLRLYGNQLNGSIPPELGDLANLTLLWLYDNQLSGSIPPELGNLTKLTSLKLSSNQLNGAVPDELSTVTSLNILELQNNQLSDIGDFSFLGTLKLDQNNFEFDDLEPNLAIGSFTYSLQANIGEEETVYVDKGETARLHLDVGGSANTYQWFKGGVAISGATTDSLILSSVQESDGADYILTVSSTTVPSLTLNSFPIHLQISLGRQADSLVLVQLYNLLGGENWKKSWDFNKVLDSLEGVEIVNNRVSSLYLIDFNLSGPIPAELGQLD
ncbi:MAG: hypothetical protein KDD94_05650, partial [Calditrichaeota bacterium]|nr:hypothetical protein [Calditrichota bacterium]